MITDHLGLGKKKKKPNFNLVGSDIIGTRYFSGISITTRNPSSNEQDTWDNCDPSFHKHSFLTSNEIFTFVQSLTLHTIFSTGRVGGEMSDVS